MNLFPSFGCRSCQSSGEFNEEVRTRFIVHCFAETRGHLVMPAILAMAELDKDVGGHELAHEHEHELEHGVPQ